MWSCDSLKALRPLAGALLLATAALAGCTSGPLYGTAALAPDAGAAGALAPLRGRIAVAGANTRTDQIVRNALLFRLNGGDALANPAYELRFQATGLESAASIEPGTGLPQSGIYRMTVAYQLVRLSDGVAVARGSRFASAPFNRSSQLFAGQRALIDARQQTGEAVAAQIELAVATAIRDAGGI